MFVCNFNFQTIFLNFTSEFYLIVFFSFILYYLAKTTKRNKYLLQTTTYFILFITNYAVLLKNNFMGYSVLLCFNHFILTQQFLGCTSWVMLFLFLYIKFFAPLWTRFLIKSQLIILLNLIFWLKILFLINSLLTFIFVFEILSLLLIFQLLFHIQTLKKRRVANFIAIFFYNFWITFLTSILFFIIVIMFWSTFHSFEFSFIECIYSLILYNVQYKSVLTLITVLSFLLFFFIKIGFIPFFFWKFTIFHYFKFNYLAFYFLFFLLPLLLFFLKYSLTFSTVFIEHSFAAYIFWIISVFLLFKSLLYFEQTWTSFLVNSTGLLFLFLILPLIAS